MVVGRFRVLCRPERVDEMVAAMVAVEGPSRDLPGVVRFDVVRSLTDPNSLLAIEVFEDRAALDRQNAQEEVAAMLRVIDTGAIIGDYEWSFWETAGGPNP